MNRGPDSAKVLRELMALKSANAVLGNHDFHLMMRASQLLPQKKFDTLNDVLTAKDKDDLLHWLRVRPLAAWVSGHLIVHAGVIPQWTTEDVLRLAREVEVPLSSNDEKIFFGFLRDLYGNEPARWSERLTGIRRLRAIVNVLTRLRFCAADGTMDFKETGNLNSTPAGMRAWFLHETRKTRHVPMVCGHWSTLGLLPMPKVTMLDSGCLWGGMLTAIRLEDHAVFQVPQEK